MEEQGQIYIVNNSTPAGKKAVQRHLNFNDKFVGYLESDLHKRELLNGFQRTKKEEVRRLLQGLSDIQTVLREMGET